LFSVPKCLIIFVLVDDGILDVLTALRRIAERNVAEVERVVRSYFNKLDDLEPFAYSEPHGFRADRYRLAKAGADWCRPW